MKTFLKQMYNNILCQVISDSGYFLFAGSKFGEIFVQSLEELDPVSSEKPRSKLCMYSAANSPINSLAFHRGFLIVGTVGVIYGLKWNEEKRKLSMKKDWEITLPQNAESFESADVNYLCLKKETDELFAGCGNNQIYQISLEDGRIVYRFQGHCDYIHCVVECDGRLYSASEDGSVTMWSLLQKEPLNKIEPHKVSSLSRPEFGKWIGALAVSTDWLICGGGPKLSLWHLRSLELTKDFNFPAKIHTCDFVDECVIVGGEHPSAHLYTLCGESLAAIPIEHTAAYSIVWQNEPIKFMSIGGYSNKLHILSDFRYLDCSVDLYDDAEN